MEQHKMITRRGGLKSALLLGITVNSGVTAERANAQAVSGSRSVLVAYFTRTGNTRVIARQIRRARDADRFEIRPAEPYPEDYEETVAQATRERESGFEPSPYDAFAECRGVRDGVPWLSILGDERAFSDQFILF